MTKNCEGSPLVISNRSSPRTGTCSARIVICKAFQAHFRDRFARCPDLLVPEFRSYLADLQRLRETEAASYEGLVSEFEVRDALKQVDLNKSPRLDGLHYEVYLRLPHVWAYSDVYVQPLVRLGSRPW